MKTYTIYHHIRTLLRTPLKLTAIMITACFLCGCAETSSTSDDIYRTEFLLDTVVTIQLYDVQDETLLDGAMELCSQYEELLSRTIETSDISKINAANGEPVTVSDDTIELLELGIYYSALSEGTFDITIAPLSILWDFSNNEGVIPDADDIANVLDDIDYRSISIDGNTVTLSNPNAMIDLGGIAKGYIADKIKEYLIENGVEHAIINLGGNILTIGGHTDGSDFNVGVQEPFGESNTAITSVSLNDQSLVSSGIYERYFELDGNIYHHILDPETGYPYDTELYGVTIISDYSVDGDALSTICMTKTLEEGLEFIQSLEDVDAIFITSNMEIITSFE